MYEFHYDYIKNKYGNNSRSLFTGADNFMYEIKTEDVFEDLTKDTEMFYFSNYSTQPKNDYSKKLVVDKTKMNQVMSLLMGLLDLGQRYIPFCQVIAVSIQKAKGVNKNVVAAISHNEYKCALLNKKCLRHSVFGKQDSN